MLFIKCALSLIHLLAKSKFMKKNYLIFFLLFASSLVSAQIDFPIDFEPESIIYTFSDFEGGVATIIDNPQPSGINTSSKVGQMVKFEGENYGGSTLVLGDTIDFGEQNGFSMKVFANRADAPVLFKLEGPVPVEVTATTTVANEWEELTFSFAGFTDQVFTDITIIYDLGTVGDGSEDFTLLFDDIALTTVESGEGVQLPIDFESETLDYVFADFAGGVATIVDNPQPDEVNASDKVGQMVKFEGEDYGGSTLTLGSPIDFGDQNAISIKVWANRVDAPVLLKLEGPVPVEVASSTTVANEWEELTFSFNGLTNGVYTGITLIYDLGVVGDGSADFTFFFDDIALSSFEGESVQIPIDFESTELTYTFSDFAGGVATLIDNPQVSGINTSAKVGQMVKFAGEDYGGSTLALGGPIDFGANTSISMKVFSNRVGAPVLLKLEGPVPVEVSANTTVANEWEILDFDFSGSTEGVYTGITIIYDLGTVGDGSADFTLLFDDIVFTGTVRVVDLATLGIRIFPNPTPDYLLIDAQEEISELTVFSLSGQRLLALQPESIRRQLDLSDLPSGTYLLKVRIGEEEGIAKIIKK